MSVRAVVGKAVGKLSAWEPESRENAASELADWAESEGLNDEELALAFQVLSTTAISDTDEKVKESSWHALSQIAMSNRGNIVSWDFAAMTLDSLDKNCLEFALVCLGFSGDAAFLPAISAQFANANSDIRESARAAYQECIFRSEKRA